MPCISGVTWHLTARSKMNLIVLLLGFRVWAGSPVEKTTRVFCAVSLLSLELQLATWTGLATLRTLVPLNIALAAVLCFRGMRAAERHADDRPDPRRTTTLGAARLALPALALLVLLLNAALPLEAADPYHLIRADRIEHLGTIAYDPSADSKLNVLGWLYELLLADLWAMPGVGALMVKFHGVWEVALFALTLAAVFQILGASSRLAWILCCVVPVVFHQFVLVKNDLFGAMPALLVLTWLVTRARIAGPWEIGWAGWLIGIAVGMKLTSFPLALVAAGTILIERREPRALGAAAAGSLVGLVSGGLVFTLIENSRVYGSSIEPLGALGNRNTSIVETSVSIWRFFISLFDLGLLTPRWWPGRGGWGSTYGLPLIWALAVLLFARGRIEARRTLAIAAFYWLAFAAVYPDADIAHRLTIAPGLLAIAVAGMLAEQDVTVPSWLRAAAVPVFALSAVQILRSATLYLARG
jgi:hypothetical protein